MTAVRQEGDALVSTLRAKIAGLHLKASRELLPGREPSTLCSLCLRCRKRTMGTTKNPVRGNLKREVWNVTTAESQQGECIRDND